MYFDRERLLQLAAEWRRDYLCAEPFPHIVIDGMLSVESLDECLQAFPAPSNPTWARFNDPHHVKLLSQGDAQLAPPIRHVLAQLRTTEFLSFLERLTGVDSLVADPHSGGCHQTQRGGRLDVHVDATWNERLHLYNAVNLFVYLNSDWSSTYGGQLELWDPEMTGCRQSVLPVFNRMVIFTLGDRTFHGHPAPLTCPPDRTRKSLASNYCSGVVPPGQRGLRQAARYRSRPSEGVSFREAVTMCTPPILMESARRIRASILPNRRRAD